MQNLSKTCTRCQRSKPLTEFYLRKQRDGQFRAPAYCKECELENSRQYLRDRYEGDPEFREAVKRRARNWEINNPERVRARTNANNAKNRTTIRVKAKEWHAAHPKARSGHHRKSRYNVTVEQFEQMVAAQNGKCMICQRPFIKTPCLDHDAETMMVRDVLCDLCNRGLGYFKEDASVLLRASEYITRHSQIKT